MIVYSNSNEICILRVLNHLAGKVEFIMEEWIRLRRTISNGKSYVGLHLIGAKAQDGCF